MRILLLATALLSLSYQAMAADDWFLLQDPDSVFSARFPFKPNHTHETQMLQDGTGIFTSKYEDDFGALSLLVAINDRGYHPQDAEQLICDVEDAFKAMATEVLADQVISLDGHPGREMIYTSKDGNHVDTRYWCINSKRYQAVAVTTMNASPEQILASKQFLDSFHFVEK